MPIDPAMIADVVPHSLAAERAVLGSILIRESALDDVSGLLTADDFLIPYHRTIFERCSEFRVAGRQVEPVSLCEALRANGELSRLPGAEEYLLDLSGSVPTAEAAVTYAHIVRSKAVLRRLIAACAEVVSVARTADEHAELLSEFRATVAALDVGGGGGPVRMGDDIPQYLDELEKRAENPSAYFVQTGIGGVDRYLGGFGAGWQVVAAARPGQGKTSFAWGAVVHAAKQGIPGLVFSLEMKRSELIGRAFSAETKMSAVRLTRGTFDMDEWKTIGRVTPKLIGLPLWIDDRTLTMPQIAAEARRWRARYAATGRAVIVIDYLGLIKSAEKTQNRAIEVGAMSRASKQMAKELDLPVILVAQLNRESVKGDLGPRQPRISDLRDSGEIEQDADVILFPWREPREEGAPPPTGPEPAKIIIGKNRHGAAGAEIDVMFDGRTMTFCDVDKRQEEGGQWVR